MPRPECTGAQSIAEQSQSGYSLQSVRTSPFVILAGRHREHPEHVSEIEQPRTLGSRPCLALDSGLLRGVASISTARMLSSLLLVGPAQTEEPTRNYCLPPRCLQPSPHGIVVLAISDLAPNRGSEQASAKYQVEIYRDVVQPRQRAPTCSSWSRHLKTKRLVIARARG